MGNCFGYIKCGQVLVWMGKCEVLGKGLALGSCCLVGCLAD